MATGGSSCIGAHSLRDEVHVQAAAETLYCLVKPHWLATFTTSRTLSLYWLRLRSLLSISCKHVGCGRD